jgi:hypothetical protein
MLRIRVAFMAGNVSNAEQLLISIFEAQRYFAAQKTLIIFAISTLS